MIFRDAKPIKYTTQEGGAWIDWENRRPGEVAHTIVFDNGRAFDMWNGWRDKKKFKYDRKTGDRII